MRITLCLSWADDCWLRLDDWQRRILSNVTAPVDRQVRMDFISQLLFLQSWNKKAWLLLLQGTVYEKVTWDYTGPLGDEVCELKLSAEEPPKVCKKVLWTNHRRKQAHWKLSTHEQRQLFNQKIPYMRDRLQKICCRQRRTREDFETAYWPLIMKSPPMSDAMPSGTTNSRSLDVGLR